MAATLVLIQTAPDYAQWKKVFVERVDLRINGGCVRSVIYRDPADPTRIVVMNHMRDLAAAKKYVQSLDLIDACSRRASMAHRGSCSSSKWTSRRTKRSEG